MRVIQSSGNEGEVNSDFLIGRDGNFQEFLQNPNSLGSVSVLSSSLLEDFSKSSEDIVGSEVESFTAFTDGGEILIGNVFGSSSSGLFDFWCGRSGVGRVISRSVCFWALVVSPTTRFPDQTHLVVCFQHVLKLLCLFLQSLFHPVQSLCFDWSHLFGCTLLGSDGLGNGRFQVDNGFQESRWNVTGRWDG